VALFRAGLIPVVITTEVLGDASTGVPLLLLAAGAAWALALLGLALSGHRFGSPSTATTAIDLALMGALVATSGGATSELRRLTFLVPMAAAFLAQWRTTAAVGAGSVGVYLLASGAHAAFEEPDELDFMAVHALYLALLSVAAAVLSGRNARIVELAASRGRLVAAALDAEERERQRLAEAIHDQPLQNLLAARQDVEEAAESHPGLERAGRAIDQTVEQLRRAIVSLHPHILHGAGLSAALERMAHDSSRRTGTRVRVHVDPAAEGVHDRLILAVGRELVSNAARHADASQITLTLERRENEIVLVVEDDGRGFDDERAASALAEGHIGLATTAERVQALAGRFEVDSRAGIGTRIEAVLPARRARPREAAVEDPVVR
jgi:two-component system NarL family sensor kinase